MAGPILPREKFGFRTRRITKGGGHSNPVFSEFHRILWCGFYNPAASMVAGFFICVRLIL